MEPDLRNFLPRQFQGQRFNMEKNERQTVKQLEQSLSKHFRIEKEVRGVHAVSGKKLRIDMIAKPIASNEWKNPDVSFGIEIKRDNVQFKNTKDYCKHISQSFDYSNTRWDGYGFVFVFAYPTVIPHHAADKALLHRICGQLGVGVIEDRVDFGLTILLNQHIMWSELNGVQEASRWSLVRKFGSK